MRGQAPAGTIQQRSRFPLTIETRNTAETTTEVIMLGWAVTFLIVALVAAVLGFGDVAGVAVDAAKIVFVVAILLFAISAIVGLVRGRAPTVP
jgi:uncharacterized membrane protein YtjA (UPF0391 family)